MSKLCVICGLTTVDEWVVTRPPRITEPVAIPLCGTHARPLLQAVTAALGEDAGAEGFSEIMRERITTLGDLAYRKHIGAA